MLLDDPPEGAGIGRADRLALIHDRGAADQQRGVDDVGMANHPADIGGGPEYLVRLDPVDVAQRPVQGHRMAAIVADDTLRDPRRARGIKNVERVGRRNRYAFGGPGIGGEFVPIVVAARRHLGMAHRPLQDHAMLGLGLRLGDRSVEQRLVGNDPVDLDAARGR